MAKLSYVEGWFAFGPKDALNVSQHKLENYWFENLNFYILLLVLTMFRLACPDHKWQIQISKILESWANPRESLSP